MSTETGHEDEKKIRQKVEGGGPTASDRDRESPDPGAAAAREMGTGAAGDQSRTPKTEPADTPRPQDPDRS